MLARNDDKRTRATERTRSKAPPGDDAKAATRAYRRRRNADTARWRSREARHVQLHQVEAGDFEYDLCVKYAGLKESQLTNKVAVNTSLGRLLRKALTALILQEENTRRR